MNDIKIAIYSDTHLREDLIFPDDVDLFIHCGDMLNKGSLDELKKAAAYFKKKLNGRKMYYTCGNHDNVFESSKCDEAFSILKEAGINTYIDAGVILNIGDHEISMYLMPYVPETTPTHSFNLKPEQLKKHIERIPLDTDILVTHGPPDYILDSGEPDNYHYGCELLLEKIAVLKSSLKLHCFGHVHQGRGFLKADDNSPLFVNAAMGSSGPNKPIIVSYPSLRVI